MPDLNGIVTSIGNADFFSQDFFVATLFLRAFRRYRETPSCNIQLVLKVGKGTIHRSVHVYALVFQVFVLSPKALKKHPCINNSPFYSITRGFRWDFRLRIAA